MKESEQKMNNNRNGINVHAIAKKILGISNLKEKDLTVQNKKDIWSIESCFKKNQSNHGCNTHRKPHGYAKCRGMKFINDYILNK